MPPVAEACQGVSGGGIESGGVGGRAAGGTGLRMDRVRSEYEHVKDKKWDDGNINICRRIARLIHSVQ